MKGPTIIFVEILENGQTMHSMAKLLRMSGTPAQKPTACLVVAPSSAYACLRLRSKFRPTPDPLR